MVYTPEFQVLIVLVSSPLALLVALWGMTSNATLQLMKSSKREALLSTQAREKRASEMRTVEEVRRCCRGRRRFFRPPLVASAVLFLWPIAINRSGHRAENRASLLRRAEQHGAAVMRRVGMSGAA